jgi:chemotaxis protein CheD
MSMPERGVTGLAARVAAAVNSRPGDSPPQKPRPALPAGPDIGGWAQARPGTELMLMPGELYVGADPARIRTLLGSCVAVTVWHATRRIGGMCHFLLPTRNRTGSKADGRADGRYGDEAVAALVQALKAHGLQPSECTAHLYGGADTMADSTGVKFNVGERNIEQGWSLIDRHGFNLDGVDVGDNVPRTVLLALATGEVVCKRGKAH